MVHTEDPNLFRSSFLKKEKSRHLPIFTSRLQLTIFGTSELNFCVRNGNRWNLTVIDTGHCLTIVKLLFYDILALSRFPVKGCTLKTEYRTAQQIEYPLRWGQALDLLVHAS